MEWIIEFIAGNLFFIVIVIGFLTSLFKKANEGKGSADRQNRRPSANRRLAGPPSGRPFHDSSPTGREMAERPSPGGSSSSPSRPVDEPFGESDGPFGLPSGPFGIPGGPFGGPGGPFGGSGGPFELDFPRGWLEPDRPKMEAKDEWLDEEPSRPTQSAVQKSEKELRVESVDHSHIGGADERTVNSNIGLRSWIDENTAHEQKSAPVSPARSKEVDVGRTVPVTATSDHMSPIYRPETPEEMSRQALRGMIWSEIYGPPLAKRRMMSRGRRTF